MVLKIQQTVHHSLDILRSPSKSEQEKIGAIMAALEAIEQLQELEQNKPKLFKQVQDYLEKKHTKAANIDDLQT